MKKLQNVLAVPAPKNSTVEGVSQKILYPTVILSMEKTVVAKVMSELKAICGLTFFQSQQTSSVALKCRTFLQKYMVFQERWSLLTHCNGLLRQLAVVPQDKFRCNVICHTHCLFQSRCVSPRGVGGPHRVSVHCFTASRLVMRICLVPYHRSSLRGTG